MRTTLKTTLLGLIGLTLLSGCVVYPHHHHDDVIIEPAAYRYRERDRDWRDRDRDHWDRDRDHDRNWDRGY